jgi:uncharacterized protein (DUF486 family)
MLLLALLLGHAFPPLPVTLVMLGIGALSYGLSIWLDLLPLCDLGAVREALLFSTPPIVGALFSLVVLRETLTPALLLAAALMVTGVLLCFRSITSTCTDTSFYCMPIALSGMPITAIAIEQPRMARWWIPRLLGVQAAAGRRC